MQSKGFFGLLALACALSVAHAQDNPGYLAGQQLGQLLAPNRDNTAYYDTLMQGLALRNAMAEAQQNKQEADNLEALLKIRQGLELQWGRAGMRPDMAHAVAWAFTPSDTDDAVFLSVRGEPGKQVGDEIRSALAARNYQLANQLLIGYLKANQTASATQ